MAKCMDKMTLLLTSGGGGGGIIALTSPKSGRPNSSTGGFPQPPWWKPHVALRAQRASGLATFFTLAYTIAAT